MQTIRELHLENSDISDNLSAQYAPVSSKLFLQPFVDQGWYTVKNINNKKKEWITLEHPDYKFTNNDTIRLEIINSYDGSCRLNIMGGLGRIVCSNGLVIGRDFEAFRFVHRGNKIYDKLKTSYGLIVAKLNKLKSDADTLKELILNKDEVNNIITGIYKEILESDTDTKKVTLIKVSDYVLDLTQRPRRKEDKYDDAFTIMNIVQEKIIRQGFFHAEVNELDKVKNVSIQKHVSKNRSENKLSSIKMNDIISSHFLSLAN